MDFDILEISGRMSVCIRGRVFMHKYFMSTPYKGFSLTKLHTYIDEKIVNMQKNWQTTNNNNKKKPTI